MKKRLFRGMNLKKHAGFTLTEVLLAVMIVGIIGVALAALTRAAARESGVGRSKIMLSNNLTSFYRQLRKDLATATVVDEVEGPLDGASFNGDYVSLIKFISNGTAQGEAIISGVAPKKIVYCFKRGDDTANITPSGDATRDGIIFRLEVAASQAYPECSSTSGSPVLTNVKYISANADGAYYPVPLFERDDATNRLVQVNIITELNTKPIVNDVREEAISLPTGS